MEKTDDCQNMPKQIVNPCQQVQYEYQYCPILGQGKIDNTNNVYQETKHPRKAQGADLYMTNNMLQSKTNSKSKHLPPNNRDILNDDNVLEEYYKKYPTQREVNAKRHPDRTESNATSVRKCSNTDQVNQPHEKVKEHRIEERKEFCCNQIMDNKDTNNQESQNNNRIQVIQIDTNASPICPINVYMLSDKEMDCEYKDMISQLTEVIEKYRNTHEIVICGDMNGSAHRDKTSHDPLFKIFLLENRIGLSINYPEKDTFYHHNGKSSGQIDYIISTFKNILKKVEIMDMYPKNTSDHVPVIAQIKRKLVRRVYKPKTTIVKTKWEKWDLNTYQSTITDGVVQVLQNSIRNIEEDIIAMEEFIHTVCDKTIPNYRKSTTRKPTGKSIWNNIIAEATKNAKIKYNQWRNAGNPEGRERTL